MAERAGGDEVSRLRRGLRRVESAVAAVSLFASWLAGAACLACLALVCYAVAMRYFLGRPQSWTDEAVGWLIVVAVMFAMPEAQRRGEHIGVDALVDRLSSRWRRALTAFGVATVVATTVILIREGVETVAFTRMIGIKSLALPDFPLWLIQAMVPFGAGLLLLVALAQLLVHLAGMVPAGPAPDKLDRHE
jgi:TRAP-type C4-dicarboxylate transport system permease small subunit